MDLFQGECDVCPDGFKDFPMTKSEWSKIKQCGVIDSSSRMRSDCFPSTDSVLVCLNNAFGGLPSINPVVSIHLISCGEDGVPTGHLVKIFRNIREQKTMDDFASDMMKLSIVGYWIFGVRLGAYHMDTHISIYMAKARDEYTTNIDASILEFFMTRMFEQ